MYGAHPSYKGSESLKWKFHDPEWAQVANSSSEKECNGSIRDLRAENGNFKIKMQIIKKCYAHVNLFPNFVA